MDRIMLATWANRLSAIHRCPLFLFRPKPAVMLLEPLRVWLHRRTMDDQSTQSRWYGRNDRDGFSHRSWMKNQGWPHDVFSRRSLASAIRGLS